MAINKSQRQALLDLLAKFDRLSDSYHASADAKRAKALEANGPEYAIERQKLWEQVRATRAVANAYRDAYNDLFDVCSR